MKENSVNHAMNTIFSIDDFSDSFLSSSPSPPPAPVPAQFHASSLNRSQSSEWDLDKFLEQVTGNPSSIASLTVSDHTIPGVVDPSVVSRSSVSSVEGSGNDNVEVIKRPYHDQPLAPPLNPCSSAPVDSDEYQAYLKSKLDLTFAAVALRAPPVKPEDQSSLIENKKQAAKTSELRSQAFVNVSAAAEIVPTQGRSQGGSATVPTQHKANGGPLAKPANQSKSGAQVRQSTSASSRDDSDDDELDGDTETTEGLDQPDEKRVRRMLSNRESARRSRRRKQAHLSDLETQVGQLRGEHSSLLKGLTDMNRKYDEAAVNNRILKADIETLRAKVQMAEETVKQVTGLNPPLLARSDVPSVGMPLVNNPMDACANAAVPMPPNPNQFFHQQVPSIRTVPLNHHRLDGGFPGNNKLPTVGNPRSNNEGENMTERSTFQHAVSLDHGLQQIGHIVSPSGAVPSWDSGLPHAGAKNDK